MLKVRIFWNLTKFLLIQRIQTIYNFSSVVWLGWNFVRFHEIMFQTDAENLNFLP